MNNSVFDQFSYILNLSILERELTYTEKQEVKEVVNSLGYKTVDNLTKKVKMQPFVAKLLINLNIDVEHWKPIYDFYRRRNQIIIDELSIVYGTFEKYGVKKVFLSENFGALLAAGNDIALFASGDIDNYVDINEYEKICAAFKSLGYSKEERYAGKLLISSDFKNNDRLPEGFEIGMEFFPLSRLKLPCFVNADEFVDWNKMRKFGTTEILLPPADALMYICLLHISLHSFNRAPAIRLYRDIVNASIGMEDADWERIKDWAIRFNTKRRISTAGYISQNIGEVAVPNDITGLSNRANERLIKIAFDPNRKVLKKEPGKIDVLLIEANCCDNGSFAGFMDILMPESEWIKSVYGSTLLSSRIKHIKNIF